MTVRPFAIRSPLIGTAAQQFHVGPFRLDALAGQVSDRLAPVRFDILVTHAQGRRETLDELHIHAVPAAGHEIGIGNAEMAKNAARSYFIKVSCRPCSCWGTGCGHEQTDCNDNVSGQNEYIEPAMPNIAIHVAS